MSLGMMSLAIVFSVQEWTGGLGAAGLLSGVFGLGNAIGLSFQGALIDRLGARSVVLIAGTSCFIALVSFVAAGTLQLSIWFMGVLALVGGIAVPAITVAVRSWLPEVYPTDEVRAASYSLLSALFRAAVTIGPLLVSVAMLIWAPGIAVIIAALMILAATIVFGFSGGHRPPSRSNSQDRPANVRITQVPGLWTIFVSAGFIGLAGGITAVAIPGVMSTADAAALAGVAFAALAWGEMLSALGFGSRRWPGHRGAQLIIMQSAVVLIAVLVFLAAGQPWLLVPLMFVAGLARAPVSVLQSALLDDLALRVHLARSYSLLVAVTLVSSSAGSSVSGLLADRLGAQNVLLLAAAAVALGWAWTATWYRTLKGFLE